jgi:hypothetical protein
VRLREAAYLMQLLGNANSRPTNWFGEPWKLRIPPVSQGQSFPHFDRAFRAGVLENVLNAGVGLIEHCGIVGYDPGEVGAE